MFFLVTMKSTRTIHISFRWLSAPRIQLPQIKHRKKTVLYFVFDVQFKSSNTIWKAYLVLFPTNLTLFPNSFWAVRNRTEDLRSAIWNSRCWSDFEGAVWSNPFVWVVVTPNKRSFSPWKRKKERGKKRRREGGKAVVSLLSIVVFVCDNTCIQAHISSLIYP